MASITFDTHKFVKELESAGVPPKQAEALLKAQQEILEHSIDNTLATKADLNDLKLTVQLKFAEYDGEFKLIKWMLGILIGGVLMIALKIYFPVPL